MRSEVSKAVLTVFHCVKTAVLKLSQAFSALIPIVYHFYEKESVVNRIHVTCRKRTFFPNHLLHHLI